MKKGSLLPVFLIILIFIVLPLSFFFLIRKPSNVRGVSTKKDFVGVVVEIKSDSVWNLSEYLCNSVEECLLSLEAGEKLKSAGGGKTELHEVLTEYSKKMDDYTYLKIFVKTGWGLEATSLEVAEFGGTTSASVHEINDIEVVLVPLDSIRTGVYEIVKFSN